MASCSELWSTILKFCRDSNSTIAAVTNRNLLTNRADHPAGKVLPLGDPITITPPEKPSERACRTAMRIELTSGVSVKVNAFEESLSHAWDQYVLNHPEGTLFHLTAWKRVVERCFGFKSCYLYAEEDGAICGVLPLFLVSNFLQGKSLISIPFAVYGGPCADSEAVESALLQQAVQMAGQKKVQYLELRAQRPIADSGLVAKELYVTFDLELPKTAAELQRIFPRDTRYMIRKAEKNGLQALVGREHLDTFYEIYSRSFHNLGTPVFPKRLFKIVFEEFGDQCELLTVWHQDKALAAVLSFRYKDWILPYFGGS